MSIAPPVKKLLKTQKLLNLDVEMKTDKAFKVILRRIHPTFNLSLRLAESR
jgi:hypothetical protein